MAATPKGPDFLRDMARIDRLVTRTSTRVTRLVARFQELERRVAALEAKK